MVGPTGKKSESCVDGVAADTTSGMIARLNNVVGLARALIPPCDHAGLTLMREGRALTAAASDEVVLVADSKQYESGNGPCLRAARSGEVVIVDDTRSTGGPFPAFKSTAKSAGIGSSLSLPVRRHGRICGALNLYADAPHVYLDSDTLLAQGVAEQAAWILDDCSDIQDLLERLERAADAKQPPKGTETKARILVVDDSPGIREMLYLLLEQGQDCTVVAEATNGIEAIAAAEAYQPDVVVLDLDMPVMNGWKALPQIVQVAPRAAVIVFSASTDVDQERLRELGAFAILPKSATLSVVDRIKQVARQSQSDHLSEVNGLTH